MKKSGVAKGFIAAGFLLLFFFGLASVIGLKPSIQPDPGRDASPSGYSALRRFLVKLGYGPQLRRDPKTLWRGAGAVIFFEYPDWDEGTWDDFYSWIEEGGAALCLGGGDGQWIDGLAYGAGKGGRLKGAPDLAVPGLDLEYDGSVFASVPAGAKVLAEAGEDPVLARLDYGDGYLALGSDPFLFSNERFKAGGEDYGVLINEIFRPVFRGPVYFFAASEGGGPVSDPIQALFRGRFLPFTLQALAACAALALAAGARFGSPLRWNGKARRASLEHVDAVGRFLLRAGASAQAEASNADYFRSALRGVLRAGADPGDGALAREAARRLAERRLLPEFDERALAGLMHSVTAASDGEMRRRQDARAAVLGALERSPT